MAGSEGQGGAMMFSKEELRKRIACAEAMKCPDCGAPLEFVPTTTTAMGNVIRVKTRKCTREGCPYSCVMD